jgi:enoyl-CoA hydratase/carnithine racemase
VSIAAVRGHAIGAGFQLALACDLRICAEDTQFTMAEVALGLVPDLGGTKRLVELVGYARALDICITGRRVPAAEADRIGLATSVVPGDELDEAVASITGQILAARRDSVVEIKALLAEAAGRSFADQERFEREAQVRRIRDLVGEATDPARREGRQRAVPAARKGTFHTFGGHEGSLSRAPRPRNAVRELAVAREEDPHCRGCRWQVLRSWYGGR